MMNDDDDDGDNDNDNDSHSHSFTYQFPGLHPHRQDQAATPAMPTTHAYSPAITDQTSHHLIALPYQYQYYQRESLHNEHNEDDLRNHRMIEGRMKWR